MKHLVFFAVSLSIAGCSLITPKVAPQVAKAVTRYCSEPYQERLVIRQSVNEMTKPNLVKVTCDGDPQ